MQDMAKEVSIDALVNTPDVWVQAIADVFGYSPAQVRKELEQYNPSLITRAGTQSHLDSWTPKAVEMLTLNVLPLREMYNLLDKPYGTNFSEPEALALIAKANIVQLYGNNPAPLSLAVKTLAYNRGLSWIAHAPANVSYADAKMQFADEASPDHRLVKERIAHGLIAPTFGDRHCVFLLPSMIAAVLDPVVPESKQSSLHQPIYFVNQGPKDHTLDEKARLAIPSKHYQTMQEAIGNIPRSCWIGYNPGDQSVFLVPEYNKEFANLEGMVVHKQSIDPQRRVSLSDHIEPYTKVKVTGGERPYLHIQKV